MNTYSNTFDCGRRVLLPSSCCSDLFAFSENTQKCTVAPVADYPDDYLKPAFNTLLVPDLNNIEIMIQDEIQNFASDAPEMLPELLDASFLKTSFLSEEFAVLTYCYECGFKMEEILNMLKDQMAVVLLYDARVSESTSYGWSCCAYSNPMFGQMFKINAKTDGSGQVMELAVTLYESMEFMSQDLFSDYNDCREKSPIGYFRSLLDVMSDLF